MSNPSFPIDAAAMRTVLCVEDHPVCMELVASMLQTRPDIRLLKATTGHDGVALARSELPDVVLLDMNLPDIGGLEVVRALSEEISRRRLRVVLLTADSFSIEVVKAMSLGAVAYWQKPLQFDTAMDGLRRLLGETPLR